MLSLDLGEVSHLLEQLFLPKTLKKFNVLSRFFWYKLDFIIVISATVWSKS